jgi:D-3-phosphoglycerate dehydrogenase
MKPTAYFVNVARGPIVDEVALIDALRSGTIAGAALDVFEQEPIAPGNPLLAMDNVVVTPHSLCWTDECFHNMAVTGLASIVDALAGRRPEFVVNPDVLEHPRVGALSTR